MAHVKSGSAKSKVPKCKKCGRVIVYAVNEEGRKVALTHTIEVYSIVYPGPKDHFLTKRAKREVYINHRLVCGEVPTFF